MRIIAGKHRGRAIKAPRGDATRPTSSRAREALFSILMNRAPGLVGCRFLDLCAGSGAIGLEAVSRGASRALLVDHSTQAIEAARLNIEHCREQDRIKILRTDVTKLPDAREPFDIVFLDPPYDAGLIEPVLTRLIEGGWLGKDQDTLIVIENRSINRPIKHASFENVDERIYGAARFTFLRQRHKASPSQGPS